jgi:hypothetical protein
MKEVRTRGRRLSAALAVLTLVASSLVGVVVTSSAAQASCAGSGVRRVIATSFGQEDARRSGSVTESCGGNGVYYGRVYDAVTDGSCVYAKFQDPVGRYYTNGVACTTGAWSNFTFWDQTGDSWALINVCNVNNSCYYNPYPHGTPMWNF